jgi:hypothetical protein
MPAAAQAMAAATDACQLLAIRARCHDRLLPVIVTACVHRPGHRTPHHKQSHLRHSTPAHACHTTHTTHSTRCDLQDAMRAAQEEAAAALCKAWRTLPSHTITAGRAGKGAAMITRALGKPPPRLPLPLPAEGYVCNVFANFRRCCLPPLLCSMVEKWLIVPTTSSALYTGAAPGLEYTPRGCLMRWRLWPLPHHAVTRLQFRAGHSLTSSRRLVWQRVTH